MSIGQSLEDVRKDLKLIPTPNLMEYKKNPGKKAIDGIPMDMLAGLELSRRAELETEQLAKNAPNPQQMPTVIDLEAQKAMGIQSLMPQGAPQQGAAPQAPQFASQMPAPQGMPQGAPQGMPQGAPPPQQMAQAPAPTGPQMPMQPTQQQPKKLAAGGIVTLKDMQDAQDQGGMTGLYGGGQPLQMGTGAGQPLEMMAGGGIVAFRNNEDQPVDADMPSDEDDVVARNTGAAFGIYPNSGARRAPPRVTDTSTEDQRRAMENYRPRRLSDAQQMEAERERNMAEVIKGTDPADNLPITNVEDPYAKLMKQIIAQQGKPVGGGGGGINTKKLLDDFRAQLEPYMKQSDAEKNTIEAYGALANATKNAQSPYLSPEQRRADEKTRRAELDAEIAPFRQQQEAILANQEKRIGDRFGQKAIDAQLRMGLAGLSGKKLAVAANEGLDYYDRISQLEDAAKDKLESARLNMINARLQDAQGNRKEAEEYVRRAEKDKADAQSFEINKLKLTADALKGGADVEMKRDKLAAGLESGLSRMGLQIDNANQAAGARQQIADAQNQVRLLTLMSNIERDRNKAGQAGLPTIQEKVALEKLVGPMFASPNSPAVVDALRKHPQGAQLLADLQRDPKLFMANPQIRTIIEQAKENYITNFRRGTRTGGGIPTMDQVEAGMQ
jgi:hypothetical protein